MKQLKFEPINGYGVLVDKEAEIKEGDYDTEYCNIDKRWLTPRKVSNSEWDQASKANYCRKRGYNFKIIFAEKELGLDVPVFEWRDFELDKFAENFVRTLSDEALGSGGGGNEYECAKQGFIEGYKSNPAKYNEEDLGRAIELGRSQGYEYASSETYSDSQELEELLSEQEYDRDKFIKSLQKYPKYVVMESELVDSGNHGSGEIFHNNRMEEFILYTNSEGRQQGIIKELIWT